VLNKDGSAVLELREGTAIVIAVSEYNGRTRLDIRTYWTPEGSDELAPTKKGVTIPIDKAIEFYDMLTAVLANAGVGVEEA